MTMTYDVTDRILTGQFTAVVRGEIPREQLPAWLERTFHDVIQYLSRHHIEATGPPFARYTFLGDQVAVEAGFPVPCEVPPDGRVRPSRLPAGPAAVTIHHGRYEDLEDAYAAAPRWLTTHGRAPIGAHWGCTTPVPRWSLTRRGGVRTSSSHTAWDKSPGGSKQVP